MEIQNLNDKFEIQDKRFYSPFIVKSKCSKCGGEIVRDMSEDCIGYPVVNKPFELYFDCHRDECGDHEWTERVILRVRLEAAPSGEDQ